MIQGVSSCLTPIELPGLPNDTHVSLAMPLIMVFLTPRELVDSLPPVRGVPGAPFKMEYVIGHTLAGGASQQGGLQGRGGVRVADMCGLDSLRQAVLKSYPQCTLTVSCVGLDKELTVMERAPASVSWYREGVSRSNTQACCLQFCGCLIQVRWRYHSSGCNRALMSGFCDSVSLHELFVSGVYGIADV